MSHPSLLSDNSVQPLPQQLECRFEPAMWGIAALFFGLGCCFPLLALFDPPKNSSEYSACFTLAAMGWVPAFFIGLWPLRARIIADEKGLRWRRLGGWKSATWSQVTGYYLSPTTSADKIIVTTAGTLGYGKSYRQEETLTRLIEQRAVNVKSSVWHIHDSGVDEGVCEFIYPEPRQDDLTRWIPSLVGALVFVLLLVMVNYGGLYLIFLPLFLVGAAPLAFWGWERYQNAEEFEWRLGQRIVVDAEGITFERSDHTLCAAWDDVTDYYLAHAGVVPRVLIRHVVVTRHGTFDFVHVPNYRRLRLIIERYATNALHRQWQQRNTDSDYEGHQVEPDGALIFSYRTRTVRAFLWGALGLTLLAILMIPLIQWSASLSDPDEHRQPDTMTPVVFFGLYIFGCSAMYWYFMTSYIRLDEQGITRRTPRGTTFIAWSDVTTLNHPSQRGHWVYSDHAAIHLSGLRPIDFEFLCKEVERRSGLEWHDKSKNTEQNAASNV